MSFDAVAYLFENDEPQAVELNLEKAGEKYEGVIETHAQTQNVFLSFANEKLKKRTPMVKKGTKSLCIQPINPNLLWVPTPI